MLKYLLFSLFFITIIGCQSAQNPSQYKYNWVIMPQYESGYAFLHGVAFVKQGGKYGLIDTSGKWLMPPQFDSPSFFYGGEGLTAVEKGSKMGFIDTMGKWAIPPQFNSARSFSEGFAAVRLPTGKSTFIKRSNFEKLPADFDNANDFSGGFAAVMQNGKWGLIDTTGKIVLSPQFEGLTTFNDNLIAAKLNGKWGFIDKTGKTVIPFQYNYDDLWFGFIKGYMLLTQGGKTGILNTKNQIISAPEYNVKGMYGNDKLFPAKKNNLCGVLDSTGKVVIPFEYDDIFGLGDGLIRVARQHKYGFIDKKGTVVVPLIYDYAGECEEGFISVGKEGRYGVIDKQGQIVVPLIFEVAEKASQGFVGVQKEGKYGYIKLSKK